MRPLFLAALNRLIRDEPRVAATTAIAPARVGPTRNVALVLIRNTEREPINFNAPALGEVKDVFVTIIQKASRTNRLEMTARDDSAIFLLDADRLDPMNRVLQNNRSRSSSTIWCGNIGLVGDAPTLRKNEPSALRRRAISAAHVLHQCK